MITKKHFAVAVFCSSVPAIFAFDIVFDPKNYVELVAQLQQMEQQYNQLVTTYEMVTNQYNQMITNARMITSKARWKAVLTPWQNPTATNTYGTTSGWISALRTGNGSAAAPPRMTRPCIASTRTRCSTPAAPATRATEN